MGIKTPLPKIESILEQQAKFSDLRQRLAKEGGEAAAEALAHLSEGPWISVSKQLGSGGIEIAHRLSERLRWQVFDREILSAIAENTHTRELVLNNLDERATSFVDDYIKQLFGPAKPGPVSFLQEAMRVILGLARKGSAIIVGRGANFFLDPRYGFRVRVVAPFDQRVTHVAEIVGLTEAEAEERVRRNDADQVAFIRRSYKADIDDASKYDLIVNTGMLGVDAAAVIVHRGFRAKFGLDD